MRTMTIILLSFCLGGATVSAIDQYLLRQAAQGNTPETRVSSDEEAVNERSNWDIFIVAVETIESHGDSLAVGKRDDVGTLQITPIIVKDANRIAGYKKYTLEDRTSREKSKQIFNEIQDAYNPEHDLHLALKIWNSRAPLSYHRAIMREYDKLTKTRHDDNKTRT